VVRAQLDLDRPQAPISNLGHVKNLANAGAMSTAQRWRKKSAPDPEEAGESI
jgi:hypothetical protein